MSGLEKPKEIFSSSKISIITHFSQVECNIHCAYSAKKKQMRNFISNNKQTKP